MSLEHKQHNMQMLAFSLKMNINADLFHIMQIWRELHCELTHCIINDMRIPNYLHFWTECFGEKNAKVKEKNSKWRPS